MKRTFRSIFWFTFILTVFMVSNSSVIASASDVQITKPVMRDYIPYGEYLKCGATAEAFVILYNPTNESYPVVFPSEVRLSAGTTHTFSNFTAAKMIDTSEYFRNKWSSGTSFTNPFILPPNSTWLLSGTISDIQKYNIQWTVDIFMTIQIGELTKNLQGMLWQRGNGCGADAIVHGAITEAYYDSDGTNGTVSMNLTNKMPDTAAITLSDTINFSAGNSTGSFSNVVWDKNKFDLAPNATQVVTASYTLEKGAAASNDSLSITTVLDYPTSLFFGHLETIGTAVKRGDVSGVITADYESDGSSGNLEISFTNKSESAVNIALSQTGLASIPEASVIQKSAGTGITLNWSGVASVSVPAKSSVTAAGTFTFTDPGITGSNKYLWLSTDFTATDSTGANTTLSAGGVGSRNPDPNPTVTPVSFCRDYSLTSANVASTPVTFQYTIQNNAKIDMLVQFAKTMAVQGIKTNAAISYTACTNGETDCLSRIDENYYLTMKPLETVTVTGTIKAAGAMTTDDKWIWTSMVYYSEESELKAFSLGYANDSCGAVAEPPIVDGDDPYRTVSPVSFCRTYQTADASASSTEIVFEYAIKNDSKYEMPAQLASTMAVQGMSTYPLITYTSCLSGESDCLTRIDRKNNITLGSYETIIMKGTVTAPIPLTTADKWIWTSMIYYPQDSETKAFALGYAKSVCGSGSGGTVEPDSSVSAVSFCRNYDKPAANAVSTEVFFQYAIQNNAQSDMLTQLATTMAVQGSKDYPLISYSACLSSEADCMDRIDGKNNITLHSSEKIILSGTFTAPLALTTSDKWLWTSMIYYPEDSDKKAFALGYARDRCVSN